MQVTQVVVEAPAGDPGNSENDRFMPQKHKLLSGSADSSPPQPKWAPGARGVRGWKPEALCLQAHDIGC